MRLYTVIARGKRKKHANPLTSILAIVGGITAGTLLSDGQYTGAFIAAIATTATIATMLALSDYSEWDERREKNLAVAAKYTIIGAVGTLVIMGASIAVPTPSVGVPLLITGFGLLAIWAAVYQYLEWRDTQ